MSTLNESPPSTANTILNSLPRAEYERLAVHLESVDLTLGEVLCRPSQPIAYVYFPNRGAISLISVFADGGSVEVGMVGNEGMFGVSIFLGSASSPLQAIVQLPGDGLRMRASVFRQEFQKSAKLRALLLRYTQSFITQLAQTAACNRAHSTNERLARWLLMCRDRAHSTSLELTHEFIATMLGTRRASVTEAAGYFQAEGLIKYNRGHITVIDREGLEAAACECYSIEKKEVARLIGDNGQAL